jgi:hypothetical protein
MCVVTASEFGSREPSDGVVRECSPVVESVGGAVRVGLLAHHPHMVEWSARKSV